MSTSKKVGVAAVIWMGSVFLSRIIGLVREAVIGRTIGGGSDADVFWTTHVTSTLAAVFVSETRMVCFHSRRGCPRVR